jgi:hypothetical protein
MVDMLNTSSGTPISLSKGDYAIFSQTHTLDPNWPNKAGITYDNTKTNIVVFIQRSNTKEIMKVEASRLVDLTVPPLTANAADISAAVGADVDLMLDCGSAQAGRNYFVLGSITGVTPGTPLPGGSLLPLTWDAFTMTVALNANAPFFANFQASLDGNGQATANFNTFGPLDPIFVGLSFHFAFTLYGPFNFVSNPVLLPVVP